MITVTNKPECRIPSEHDVINWIKGFQESESQNNYPTQEMIVPRELVQIRVNEGLAIAKNLHELLIDSGVKHIWLQEGKYSLFLFKKRDYKKNQTAPTFYEGYVNAVGLNQAEVAFINMERCYPIHIDDELDYLPRVLEPLWPVNKARKLSSFFMDPQRSVARNLALLEMNLRSYNHSYMEFGFKSHL
ncbi:hypothetical protein ACTWQB_09430 [Piscibacillus sp. B03]|uniref:hypothetical protein n=1 Tax=Piscibacillus sp. B03 TaxID=3457430 RepID=UPI003FCD8509